MNPSCVVTLSVTQLTKFQVFPHVTCIICITVYHVHLTEGLSKRDAKKLASSTSSTPTKGAGPVTVVNTARYHIASELLQTEKNFVKILTLIVQVIVDYMCT